MNRRPLAIVLLLVFSFSLGAVALADRPPKRLQRLIQKLERAEQRQTLREISRARLVASLGRKIGREAERLSSRRPITSSHSLHQDIERALAVAMTTLQRVQGQLTGESREAAASRLTAVLQQLTSVQERHRLRVAARDQGLTFAKVEIGLTRSLITLLFQEARIRWLVPTTDLDSIVRAIADRTRVPPAAVRLILRVEREDEDEEAFELPNRNGNVNENRNLNLNQNLNAPLNRNQNLNGNQNLNRNVNTNRNDNENRNENLNENVNARTDSSGPGPTDGWEIEVRVRDGIAAIRARTVDQELIWRLATTDENLILQDISRRTGLTIEQILSFWRFRVED